jgi:RND family efflux transporter MFP subunit
MSRWRLAASLLLAVACHREETPETSHPPRVRCVVPTASALDEVLELRGHIEPPPGGDLPLASQVSGRIVEVLVREGERVTAGQIVASVDDAASKQGERQAQATLAQAKTAAANASAATLRTQALVDRGISAHQELEDAQARAETEKQNVLAAEAGLELARRTLGRVQVRAAFPGLVTKLWRGPGAIVDGSAATPIAQVATSSSAEFVADVMERDLAKLRAGQSAEIELMSSTARLRGSVRTLSAQLDETTGLAQARIVLEPSPSPPLIGAHGRVRVGVNHRESARMLPRSALRGAIADGAEVVVCDHGKARVQEVQVGYRDAERFELVSGLEPGAKVALDHVLGLDDGAELTEAP